MDKKTVLENSTFGKRVAEEEGDLLADYFVKTEQWRRILSGEVDIIYGPKGSGKSALYSLLTKEFEKLRVERRIVAIPAENPRGTPAFRDLINDPPASEEVFRQLWKFYFLILLADYVRLQLNASKLRDASAEQVISLLVESGLLLKERNTNLKSVLSAVLDYVRTRAISFQGDLKADAMTGLPQLSAKITFSEPTNEQRFAGSISADEAFSKLTGCLGRQNIIVWLLLDRLDVAFTENTTLEKNALRALFRTYLDLDGYHQLSIKIFLRDDIWRRIVEEGFREASHITRSLTIEWNRQSLLNLIVRRALFNPTICTFYGADAQAIFNDADKQSAFFYMLFPEQVAVGKKQPNTLDWMLTRVADAFSHPAPRELIHLLQVARDSQLRAYELGDAEPAGMALIGRSAIKDSLPEVSKVRFNQTLCAEYPVLRKYLLKLENKKAAQSLQSFARIIEASDEEGKSVAEQLVEAGFFLKTIEKGEIIYWVPFLYRDALHLVQGAAD